LKEIIAITLFIISLNGGNKKELRRTFCLFLSNLAYVVSHFKDLNYEKQGIFSLDYNLILNKVHD
jgi:hypothetical protein